MSFLPQDPLFLGLEITPLLARLALVKKHKGRFVPLLLEEIPLENKKNILQSIPVDCTLATTLPAHEVLVKSLYIPLKGEKEIAAAFKFQVEPLLPYPLDRALVNYLTAYEKSQGTQLTVFSVKKESIEKHLDYLKKDLSIEPEKVFCPALSIAALASLLPPSDDPLLFIHIGEEEGICCLIEKGKLTNARAFEKEILEIQKTILGLTALVKGKSIDTLFLLAPDTHWKEEIQNITQKMVVTPVLPNVNFSEEELSRYGLAFGLAIAAAQKDIPHFRREEYAPPFPWKKVRKSLVTFAACSLLFFSGLYTLETLYFKNKEKILLENFQHFSPQKVDSIASLESGLEAIEKHLEVREDLFPLLPKVPKARDLLAWLSSYIDSGVKIEAVQYRMNKRPDIERKKEPYQIEVELLLSATTAAAAEKFHAFLKSSNSLMDAKKEVLWSAVPEKKAGDKFYKAQFFLKDKTRYN